MPSTNSIPDNGGTMTEQLDLTTLHLATGGHTPDEGEQCLMEAVAWFAGEEWSDRPACASPLLGVYGRGLNDILPDEKRQQLVPFVPRIVGTAGDGLDQARGLMAADWLVRVYAPAWLRLAGFGGNAAALESLARLASWDDVLSAQAVLDEARVAAWNAAGNAAWDAAWDAAGNAAWVAARAAAGVAAGVAARAALQPTVESLQDSAIHLLDAMLSPASGGAA